MKHDLIYIDLVKDIFENGIEKNDRTGIKTISVFGRMLSFDVSEYVPILTTKKLHLKSIIYELLWFLKGDTNIKFLNDNGVSIWDEWADENGDLGPIYGKQWRNWEYLNNNKIEQLDQLTSVISEIKQNPLSRRLLLSAWNAPKIWNGEMKLPPCHWGFLFNVEEDKLNLKFEMRSVDVGLGLPYNIASYTLLLYMVASLTGYKPNKIIASLGDTHIYLNHIDSLKKQIFREPFQSPKLIVNPSIKCIDDFCFEDFNIINYEYHPSIKMDIAV